MPRSHAAPSDTRLSGKIARIIVDKGFFFIKGDTDGVDYFGHMSSLEDATIHDLKQGQRVSYILGDSAKGPRAEQIRISQ